MELTLKDYYQFFKMLPLGDDQVQFRYQDQIEVFGDQYRRIIYNADLKEDAEQFIEGIKTEFSAFDKIQWKVGETDRPEIDWGSLLENQGFEQTGIELAMIFDLHSADLSELEERLEAGIEIIEVESSALEDDEFFALKKRNFGRSDEMVQASIDNYLSLKEKGLNFQQLIAKSDDRWVGHAVLNYIDDTEVAFLAGAMTDEKYRKQGIYSTMLAKRASHAKKMGKRFLVINAVANTSGAILKKIGFHTIAEQIIYSYE